MQVVPLVENGGSLIGVSIAFTDITESRQAKDDLEKSTRALETAQEELQSANEELETTNEELQSTNEELEAVNEEFRQRTEELNEVNFFLEAVLSSLTCGIAMIDHGHSIRCWNPKAEDL